MASNSNFKSTYELPNHQYQFLIKRSSKHLYDANVTIQCAKNFGNSFANLIRKSILLGAEAFAICGVHIHGINHEYAILPGISHPISYLIHNLKNIIIGNNDDHILTNDNKYNVYKATINKSSNDKKPYIVTAADIEIEDGLKILNPDLEICTLDVNKSINMDLFIIYGSGFKSINDIKYKIALPSDTILLDCNFAKDIVVSAHVVEDPVSRYNYDCVEIKIQTSPLHIAINLYDKAVTDLHNLFEIFKNKDYQTTDNLFNPHQKYNFQKLSYNSLIETLYRDNIINEKTYICLKNANIIYISDLVKMSDVEIKQIPDITQECIDDINNIFGMKNNILDNNIETLDAIPDMIGQRTIQDDHDEKIG